ncbi:late embryogenesis abundant (LEA) protein-like protein [Tasmannia lanceolata]|uniref:late embryogenesis abundant (LEA) protein-like protein n=1 Tax=Tasmannia lanceolata TaxID=3420 RepID=UPI004063A79E
MKFRSEFIVIFLLFFASVVVQILAASPRQLFTCPNRKDRCFLRPIRCPMQCPTVKPVDPKSKGCFVDCNSPKCEAVCRNRMPNCDGLGAACFDPRFIGGDGIMFYFHGKRDEHFSLVSDSNLHINARFIGLRPTGRNRDYTWIQALGIMFNSDTFSVEAKKTVTWNDNVDHLLFSYNGEPLLIPEGHLSEWWSQDHNLVVERTSNRNSVIVTVAEIAEISVKVAPVTNQDDKIHNYHIPSDNCFAHLEVQFRFFGLSPKVEGVLGQTYRPDFKNSAKHGVAMPVVGGENKYRTTSLLSPDCSFCIFSPAEAVAKQRSVVIDSGTLDCTGGVGNGYGIVCKK